MLGQPAGPAEDVLVSALESIRAPLSATLRGLRRCDPDDEYRSLLRDAWTRLEFVVRELQAAEPRLRLYALDPSTLARARALLDPPAAALGVEIVDGDAPPRARAGDLAVLALDGDQAGDARAARRWARLNEEHGRTRLFCLGEDATAGEADALNPMDLLHAAAGPAGARRLIGELAPRRVLERVHAAYDDLLSACRRPEVAHHAERWRQFEPVLREESRLRTAVCELAETGESHWHVALEPLRLHLLEATRGRARQLAQAQVPGWIGAVGEWFQSDAGLSSLIDDELAPLQESIQERAWCAMRSALIVETAGGQAHDWIPAELLETCESADVSVAHLAVRAAREVPRVPVLGPVDPVLSAADIPLRPTLGFLRVLRGDEPLRRRIFGQPGGPRPTLTPEDKARWLSGDARGIMEGLVIGRLGEFAQEQLERCSSQITRLFARALCTFLRRKMHARTRRLDAELTRVERLFTEHDDLGQHLAHLEAAIVAADAPLLRALQGEAHPAGARG